MTPIMTPLTQVAQAFFVIYPEAIATALIIGFIYWRASLYADGSAHSAWISLTGLFLCQGSHIAGHMPEQESMQTVFHMHPQQ